MIISLFLAHSIETQHEIKMRLQALDVATATIERLHLGLPVEKTVQAYVVTVVHADITFNQQIIDALIPRSSDNEHGGVQPVEIVVAWKNSTGNEKKVRLLTALPVDTQGKL